ncbi:MAG: hypothetical protein GY854_32435 [Deltaproteobacteria bacterium]|nr:hypothetical protein [Deltaproteobacteria bacterium]
MGNIIIPGFPTGMLVPGIYLNVELGKAPPSAARVRKVLLASAESSSGQASSEKYYRVSRLNSKYTDGTPDMGSAETLFGKSHELYKMTEAAFTANPTVSLYAVAASSLEGSSGLFGTDDPCNIAAQRFDYIVIDELDNTDDLILYLNAMADPKTGLRQQGIVGSAGSSPADLSQNNDASMSPRLQHVWADQSDHPTDDQYQGYQVAAAMASVRARFESIDPAVNLCFEGVPGVPAPKNHTKTELNSLLQDGVSPLVATPSGSVILRSVTTAANPSDNQNPVLDTGKVTVTDYVADDITVKMLNRYTGFKLSPDTDVPPPARTATPNGIKNALLEWLRMHEKAGRITSVESLADAVRVEIDPDADGRVNFEIAEDVIEIFAVGAGNIIQMG